MKEPIRAAILTEGGKGIGFGHITRCTGLYEALDGAGFRAKIFVNAKGNLRGTLAGVRYSRLNWLAPGRISKILESNPVCLVDSYLAGGRIYRLISEGSSACLFVDDNMRLDYPSGIIANGTVLSEYFNYKRRPGSKYLLGGKYAALRKPFWKGGKRVIREELKDILVTFGGTDPLGLTAKALKTLVKYFPEANKHLLLGPGLDKNYVKMIKAAADSRTFFHAKLGPDRVKALMYRCDAAVSAAGQTTFELARTGLPSIIYSVAGNQANNSKNWVKTGFALGGGAAGKSDISGPLSRLLRKMKGKPVRKKMSGLGTKAVDGQGAIRIAAELMKAYKNNG